MNKVHCDACGEVIEGERTPSATVELLDGSKMALVVEPVPGYRENVHVCLYCALKVLNERDTRDRAAPAVTGQDVRRYHRAELDALVGRFLAWPVPDNELADECASSGPYTIAFPHTRSGTNFLSSAGARAMLAHVLELEL